MDDEFKSHNDVTDEDDEDLKGFYNFHPGYSTPPDPDKKPKGPGAGLTVGLVCGAVFLMLIVLAAIGIRGIREDDFFLTSSEMATASPSNVSSAVSTPSHSYSSGDLDFSFEDTPSSADEQNGVKVAKKVCPSIVGIVTYTKSGEDYRSKGQGSGIILSEDGFILTNAHVISGADRVTVMLYSENGMSEENSFVAEVVGADSTTDLALLKISATGLSAASFADSDDVSVGETVYTVGNPGGVEYYASVSQGIVSGLNRYDGDVPFIQTDAAINPGSSGGALVNVFGQVIGVTSEKLLTVSSISAEGMSFAIPTSVVMPVVNDLLSYGYVRGRVSLRLTIDAYNNAYAAIAGFPDGCRLRINEVAEGSNAANAGVKKGLFITEINGVAVTTMKELKAERDMFSVGDTITLTLYDLDSDRSFTVSFALEEDRGS